MSQRDFDKWETRYRSSPTKTLAPEAFIVECTQALTAGAAIDIAGGAGRHAALLASRGWTVTLTDIAPAALAHAQAQITGSLTTRAVDFDDREASAAVLPPEAFELVVCAWYLPTAALWTQMVRALRPGGHLVYVQPTQTNLTRHERPSARFLFADNALPDHLAALGLEVIRAEEGWDARGHHTARALARRP